MPSNLDLVRSVLSEWECADFRSVAWAHPQIEYIVIGGPGPGKWGGVREMTKSVRDFMGAWESYGITAEKVSELDAERVLVLVQLSGRGKVSGLKLEDTHAEGAEVWHLRDGKAGHVLASRRSRRRPRTRGVNGVAGELMTTLRSSPTTDEMARVSAYF